MLLFYFISCWKVDFIEIINKIKNKKKTSAQLFLLSWQQIWLEILGRLFIYLFLGGSWKVDFIETNKKPITAQQWPKWPKITVYQNIYQLTTVLEIYKDLSLFRHSNLWDSRFPRYLSSLSLSLSLSLSIEFEFM